MTCQKHSIIFFDICFFRKLIYNVKIIIIYLQFFKKFNSIYITCNIRDITHQNFIIYLNSISFYMSCIKENSIFGFLIYIYIYVCIYNNK